MTDIDDLVEGVRENYRQPLTELFSRLSGKDGEVVLLNRIVSITPLYHPSHGMAPPNRALLSDAYAGRLAGSPFLHHHPVTKTTLSIPSRDPYSYTADVSFPVISYHGGFFSTKGINIVAPKSERGKLTRRIFFGLDELEGSVPPRKLSPGLLARLQLFEILIGEAEIMHRAEEYHIGPQEVKRCLAKIK